MILNSLPDAKNLHDVLTIGKEYEVLHPFGANGTVIRCDKNETNIAILSSRLSPIVTAWYRWIVDAARPLGCWEFNHIEDGFVLSRMHPTPKTSDHERVWKGGKWFGARAHLESSTAFPSSQKVVLDCDMPLNIHFEFEHCTRDEKQRDGSVKTIDRLRLKYKGEGLAIFEGDTDTDRLQQARAYICTHGYLAEWIFQKHKTGKYQSWTEKLRVYP